MTDHSTKDDRNLDVPERLAAHLRRSQHTPVVSPQVDLAVLGSGKLRMRRQRRYRVVARWAGGAVAAAAAIAAVMFYAAPVAHEPSGLQASRVGSQPSAVLPADVPGRPTILDAFQLARRLDRGAVSDSRWDVNGDGVIDRKDIDALALAAVSLKGEKA